MLKKNKKNLCFVSAIMSNKLLQDSKRSQVWVETAIYTLIGLTIIAILLAVATPQIEKIKDQGIIDQTMVALNTLDTKISEAEQTQGSIRIVDFRLTKGRLEIDPSTESITYILENTRLELSEPGELIQEGDIILKTEEYGSRFNIMLQMDYSRLDLTYDEGEELKVIHGGTTPHKLQIKNIDVASVNEKTNIDINII